MKINKIIALCLAAVIAALSVSLVACNSGAPKITVTFNIRAGSTSIASNRKVTVAKEDPVVVDAINAAVEKFTDIKVSLTSDGSRIEGVNDYEEKTVDDDTYYWSFTVNDKKPTAGDTSKITTYPLEEGDVVTLVFYRYNNVDSKEYEYDANNDYQFGVEEEEETEAEETEAEAAAE